MQRIGIGVLAASILALAGCSTPPPEEPRPEAVPPASPPPIRPAPARPIRTTWSFRADAGECVAAAAAGASSLVVTVQRGAPVRLTVSLTAKTGAALPLHFTGAAGTWRVTARRAGSRRLVAALGSDYAALGRVLILLGGGVLEVGEGDSKAATLVIEPSNDPGRQWFECARATAL